VLIGKGSAQGGQPRRLNLDETANRLPTNPLLAKMIMPQVGRAGKPANYAGERATLWRPFAQILSVKIGRKGGRR